MGNCEVTIALARAINRLGESKMALPVSYWGQTLNDNTLKSNGDAESSSFRFPITTLTAANVVAQTALLATLDTAIQGVTMGVIRSTTTILEEELGLGTPAGSPLAQRENKYLLRMHDLITGKKFTRSLPTADLSLLANNSEFLDITAGAGLTLKNAIEAVVKSPYDGANAVVLDTVQFVGRNT